MRWCRVFAVASSLVLGGSIATGCGGSESEPNAAQGGQPEESVTVGVVVPSVANPYFKIMSDGAKAAADANPGVEVMVAAGARGTPEEQVDNINDMLTKGADALVVSPGLPQMKPTLEQALEDGVPVVFADADLSGIDPSRVTVVGTNTLNAGRTAGEFIKQTLDGKGQVGILVGLPGVKPNLERTDGAKEVFKGTGIEVVAELPTDCQRVKGVNATEDMLTANPDIDLIYAGCADPILGAVKAVERAGKTGEVKLVGFDAQPEEIENILSGSQFGSIAQFPEKMGRIGVEKAVEALRTGETPENVDTGTAVVTKENADSFTQE